MAADLGADATADYTRPGWSADLGEAVDVVFDGVGGDLARDAFDLIRDGGRMYCYGAASGAFAPVRAQDAARRGIALVRGVQVGPEESRELSAAALAAAAANRIRPLIGQRFALEDAARAHAAIEARATIGKTLLLVGSS